jgi:hypothetical protein
VTVLGGSWGKLKFLVVASWTGFEAWQSDAEGRR